MRDLSDNRSLPTVVGQVVTELGGRVDHDRLEKEVRKRFTLAEYDVWIASAFRAAVIRAAKQPKTGLASVYGTGEEVVVAALFTFEEFEDKAMQLAGLSKANRSKVHALARMCMEVHDRTFDADAILAEADAA